MTSLACTRLVVDGEALAALAALLSLPWGPLSHTMNNAQSHIIDKILKPKLIIIVQYNLLDYYWLSATLELVTKSNTGLND